MIRRPSQTPTFVFLCSLCDEPAAPNEQTGSAAEATPSSAASNETSDESKKGETPKDAAQPNGETQTADEKAADAAGKDAEASTAGESQAEGAEKEVRIGKQTRYWQFSSRSQCLSCHSNQSEYALAFAP